MKAKLTILILQILNTSVIVHINRDFRALLKSLPSFDGARLAFRQLPSEIDAYAPNFSSSVIGYEVLPPPDIEKIFGLTGGNIFHGSMSLDQLYFTRPVSRYSNYTTPIKGLYLCGSGAHPGGGVTGAPGRLAALIAMQD
ncbi:unnamed protein product [Strongylus vulgaris]|uniref:Amine oxidase domain-containing protein n=1 Tax=Strongylus vulgaris TaxID=40348 RepID=A0A3P7J8P0_STRVU|nr:unnamed protein product [Strongylus vulgaris]